MVGSGTRICSRGLSQNVQSNVVLCMCLHMRSDLLRKGSKCDKDPRYGRRPGKSEISGSVFQRLLWGINRASELSFPGSPWDLEATHALPGHLWIKSGSNSLGDVLQG